MTEETRNLISGKAPKLRGPGCIHYSISKYDKGLHLVITGNDQGGKFDGKPICLGDLLACIASKGESFRSSDLRCVIPGHNNNDPAFVVAILKDIRFVTEADVENSYCLRRE